MAIPKFTEDMDIIGKLGDYPGSDDGLSTDAFREKFDEAGKKIKAYLNDTLTPELDKIVDVDALIASIVDTSLSVANKAAEAAATGAALEKKLNKSGGAMTGPIDMQGNKLSNVPAPASDLDAANKQYVDTRHINGAVTLYAGGWANNTQTVSFPGVTADTSKTDIYTSPAPADDNYAAYVENGVRPYSQGDGTITFKCEDVPSVNVVVNVSVEFVGIIPASGAKMVLENGVLSIE